MPKVSEMFPSKYLKASDLLGRQFTLTIKRAVVEPLGMPPEDKLIVYFVETDKGLALNKTNANTIVAQYGDDTDYWRGKQLTIYPTEVAFQGKMVETIRVSNKVVAQRQPVRQPEPEPVAPPIHWEEEEEQDPDIPF